MKIFKAYFKGLKVALRNYKISFVIYLLNLLLALIIVAPLMETLKMAAGNSLPVEQLAQDFNATAFSEWINSAEIGVKALINSSKWVIFIYYLFSIFFAGGVIFYVFIDKRKFAINSFFEACATYFFRNLRLNIYILFCHLITILIIYLPLFKIIEILSYKVDSEIPLFFTFLGGVCFHLLVVVLLFLVSDYAKINMLINDSKKSFKSLIFSFKFAFRHFFKAYFLTFLLVLVPVGLVLLFFLLNRIIKMELGFTIILLFIIQQIFIYLRIFTRVWIYGSQLSFYTYYQPVGIEVVVNEGNEISEVTKTNKVVRKVEEIPLQDSYIQNQ